MKDLMKSNIYDCSDKIIIVGSCLKAMQPKAFEELQNLNLPMFELCLEQTHINMAITKLLGMIRARKISKVIFASVDKSPHCIQLHYLQDEITRLKEKSEDDMRNVREDISRLEKKQEESNRVKERTAIVEASLRSLHKRLDIEPPISIKEDEKD